MVGAALQAPLSGMIPALLLGTALGVVPRPGRERLSLRATSTPSTPSRRRTPAAPGQPGSEPAAAPRAEPVAAGARAPS